MYHLFSDPSWTPRTTADRRSCEDDDTMHHINVKGTFNVQQNFIRTRYFDRKFDFTKPLSLQPCHV